MPYNDSQDTVTVQEGASGPIKANGITYNQGEGNVQV